MIYTVNDLIKRYPILDKCKEDIISAYNVLENCYTKKGKLLIAGNGGSCSDAEHIVGELMKGFKNERRLTAELTDKLISIDLNLGRELSEALQQALPAIALDGHQSLNTAFTNDVENGGLMIYSQQIMGYGYTDDVFLAISTSGNAKNLIYAAITAKAKGLKVIALTGKTGGVLKKLADVAIVVPCDETFMIQELHLPIYHLLCLMLENHFFNN